MPIERTVVIHDTFQGKAVELKTQRPGVFTMYYCGPTVYNYVHLGNLRPVVVFDVFARLLKAVGYRVKVVSNYTDIDDKIIAEAIEEKKSERELADFYIQAYEEGLSKLNLLPLFDRPRVSGWMERIGAFVQALYDKGYAYRIGGDVYFRTGMIPSYGALSKTVVEKNQAGARIQVNDEKEEPSDFALWKVTSDEGVKFNSPFGRGRPGWHTECVVMIKSVFDQPVVDVHGGGFDLKFPHHENERAQSLAYDQTGLAKYWMHVGFLTGEGGVKMSKSLGNVVLAKDFLQRHGGNVLRLFFYQSHYRAPIALSEASVQKADADAKKYASALQKVSFRLEALNPTMKEVVDPSVVSSFLDALCDDLNLANAITVLDGEVKKALTLLRSPRPDGKALASAKGTLVSLFDSLGLLFPVRSLTEEDRALLQRYAKAREEKDFATSDALRPTLMEKDLL